MIKKSKSPKDGKPCFHPGCLSHISHPCEGCGRIGGSEEPELEEAEKVLGEVKKIFQRIRDLIDEAGA